MSQEIVVPDSKAVETVEHFLRSRFPIGYVRKLFRKNAVRINGNRANRNDIVRAGAGIQLYIPFEKQIKGFQRQRFDPKAFKKVFEDQDLWVIDKPAGIAVHEGKRVSRQRSLLGFLEAKHRDMGIAAKLVHRLDKDTSGILIVAKNEQVAQELERAFAKGDVRKQYLCLVAGRLPRATGTINFPLPGREGKPVSAITHFTVTKRFSQTTLIRVKLETGRMHQIRQHCARFGHPIVLDDRYGDFSFNRQFRRLYGLKRQFLHATSIAVPYKGSTRKWTAPLPRDLEAVLTSLEAAEEP